MERPPRYVRSALHAWIDALHAEDRSRAALKPALLLVVLDLLYEGALDPSRVVPDDRIAHEFDDLLERAKITANPGAAWQPFFHLGTRSRNGAPFWTLHDAKGAALTVTAADVPRSWKALRAQVAYASFPPELAAMLHAPEDREAVRALVYEWLEERPTDAESVRLLEAHDRDWLLVKRTMSQVRERSEGPFVSQVERPVVAVSDRILRVRDRGFRLLVVPAYEHRCAVCTLRLRWGSKVEAEAAHIIPVDENGPDDVRNALSLCRTHHWAFDAHLWTVDAQRRIVVAPVSDGPEVDLVALRAFHGNELIAPAPRTYAPDPVALAHHRARFEARFRAA